MLNKAGKIELCKILQKSFGKCQFDEGELTENFWTDLYIAASDFFKADGNGFNLDLFWSDSVKTFLLEDKTQLLKEIERNKQ